MRVLVLSYSALEGDSLDPPPQVGRDVHGQAVGMDIALARRLAAAHPGRGAGIARRPRAKPDAPPVHRSHACTSSPRRAISCAAGQSSSISSTSRPVAAASARSEEHTSELQSLMRISYAVFCLKKKNKKQNNN